MVTATAAQVERNATFAAATARALLPTATSTPRPRPTPTPKPAGRVLFVSNRASWDDIYSMNEDGSDVRRLTTIGKAYRGRYSPDGNKIVFDHNGDLYLMNADGSGLTSLTNTVDKGELFPVWSPDGSKIAYVFAWWEGYEIYTVNADGSDPKPVTVRFLNPDGSDSHLPYRPRYVDIEPAWSPDGTRIAFASTRNGKVSDGFVDPFLQIFVVNANGTGLHALTSNDFYNRTPIWSPDGTQIAFTQYNPVPGEQWKVMIMNADGSGQRVVINAVGNDPGNSTIARAWIGNRLLIGGYRGNWDVYYINVDGTGLTAITNDPKDDTPTDWWLP